MNSIEIVNCTQHDITLSIDGVVHQIAPSGYNARVLEELESFQTVMWNGNPVQLRKYKQLGIVDLPEPQEGVIYVTSAMVREAANRADVVSPDTGLGGIRGTGRIAGTTGFKA